MSIKERIYVLDILRASAILFVLYSHGLKYLDGIITEKRGWSLAFDGVDLFFVLSGYLIGGILIKTIERNENTFQNLFNFWIRRWFRTLPNYFLILLLLILLSSFSRGYLPDSISKYFYFFQNFGNEHPAFFPEAWSLSVEEWFYLLMPLCLFLFLSIKKLALEKVASFFKFL